MNNYNVRADISNKSSLININTDKMNIEVMDCGIGKLNTCSEFFENEKIIFH